PGSHGTPAAGGRGGIPPPWPLLGRSPAGAGSSWERPLFPWDSLGAWTHPGAEKIDPGREKRVDMLAHWWYSDSTNTLAVREERGMMENRRELEEKAYEWVAYCTDCKAAVEVDDDPHIVQAAALTHVNRFHGHQV